MVVDGYDLIAPSVTYLNWSSYTRTLLLLQISILATVGLFFVGPYIPIRPVLLIGGELAFLANHPWAQPALEGITRRAADGREGEMLRRKKKELMAKARELVEQDRLDDVVWERGWRNVEMFE